MKKIGIAIGLTMLVISSEINAGSCIYVAEGSTSQYTGTVNASGLCCYQGSCGAANVNAVTAPAGAINQTPRVGGLNGVKSVNGVNGIHNGAGGVNGVNNGPRGVNGVNNGARHHSAGGAGAGRRGR